MANGSVESVKEWGSTGAIDEGFKLSRVRVRVREKRSEEGLGREVMAGD